MNLHDRLERIEGIVSDIKDLLLHPPRSAHRSLFSSSQLDEYKHAMREFAGGDRRRLDKFLAKTGGRVPR